MTFGLLYLPSEVADGRITWWGVLFADSLSALTLHRAASKYSTRCQRTASRTQHRTVLGGTLPVLCLQRSAINEVHCFWVKTSALWIDPPKSVLRPGTHRGCLGCRVIWNDFGWSLTFQVIDVRASDRTFTVPPCFSLTLIVCVCVCVCMWCVCVCVRGTKHLLTSTYLKQSLETGPDIFSDIFFYTNCNLASTTNSV